MTAEPLWYFERGGERHGPVSAAEILEALARGELGPGNLVWRQGMADWTRLDASELAGPAGLAGSAATDAPLPPAAPAPPPVPVSAEPYVPREARLRPGFRPSIRSCLDRAWALLKTRFWPLVGCFALTTLILGVASQLYFPVFFLIYPIMGGLYWYILRVLRGREANLEMLFEGFRRQFGPLAIANLIVMGIATIVLILLTIAIVTVAVLSSAGGSFGSRGDDPVFIALVVGVCLAATVVFLIPLMVLGVVGNFANILILDCALDAGPALSLAWRATKPHLVKLVLFMFVSGLLSTLGMLALYVGVFVTGAWSTIAFVILYEDAFGESPDTIPAVA